MNAKRRQLQRKQRELDLEQSSSHASSFSSLNNNNNNNNNNQSNFTNTSKHFKSRLMNNQNKQQQQQQLQQQTSSSHYDIPIPQNNPTSPSIHLFKATNTSPNNQYSNPLSIATSPNYISIPLASQLHTDKHSTQHHNYNNHHQRNFPQTKVHEPQFLIKNAQRAPNAASSVVSILKQQQQPLTTVNDLPPHKPTESERIEQLNKMIKIFKLGNNINADNILVGDNNIYAHNKKEIAELQSRIENEEMKLHNLMISNKNVTQEYIERIIQLQNDIMNSPKGDIISLEEANKVDDVVIKNLLYKKKKVKEEYEMERNELKKMISERIKPMINELKKEIKEVQELKRQLKECKEKELPKDMKNKLEVVIHYKTEN